MEVINIPDLPLEVVEHIGSYLEIKDAKNISTCSRLFYFGMQRRIWSAPRFYFYDKKKNFIENAWKFPVKCLWGFDLYGVLNGLKRFEFLQTLDTLNKYIVDVNTLRSDTLEMYVNCGFEVSLSSVILNPSRRQVNKIYTDIMRKGDNFVVQIEVLGVRWEKWSLQELEMFVGLRIQSLQVQAVAVTTENKAEFYKLLKRLNPEDIDFGGLEQWSNFKVDRKDFADLRELNIKSLGSWYCDKYPITSTLSFIERLLPWKEIKHLKKLKKLIFGEKGFISIEKLLCFDIYGVQIGNGMIYYDTPQNLVKRLIDYKCLDHKNTYTHGTISPAVNYLRLSSNRTLTFFIRT